LCEKVKIWLLKRQWEPSTKKFLSDFEKLEAKYMYQIS